MSSIKRPRRRISTSQLIAMGWKESDSEQGKWLCPWCNMPISEKAHGRQNHAERCKAKKRASALLGPTDAAHSVQGADDTERCTDGVELHPGEREASPDHIQGVAGLRWDAGSWETTASPDLPDSLPLDGEPVETVDADAMLETLVRDGMVPQEILSEEAAENPTGPLLPIPWPGTTLESAHREGMAYPPQGMGMGGQFGVFAQDAYPEYPESLEDHDRHFRDMRHMMMYMRGGDEPDMGAESGYESDPFDGDESGSESDMQQGPRKGTTAWAKQHASWRIYNSDDKDVPTIREAAYFMLNEKLTGCMSDGTANRICRSMEYVRAVMDVKDPNDYAIHLCAAHSCSHAWPHIEPGQFRHHSDDRCPFCDAPRFINMHGQLQPSRRAWVFPLQEVIQSLFDDDEFAANVTENRSPDDPTSIFSTSAMKEQNDLLQGAFEESAEVLTIPCEIGGDGVQVLVFGTRTCSIMAIRVLGLPASMSHSKLAYRVVAVIEGRSEKKELRGITTKIVQDFMQYYPGTGQPMKVHVGSKGDSMLLHLALCRAQGDNPYLTKLACTGASTSYYACKWCFTQGANEVVTPDGQGKEDLPAMRSGGYDKDLPCTLHAIIRKPLEDGRCAWQWHKVENHCLRDNDGTLNSAEGRLLVTTEAAEARAATAERASQVAVENVDQRVKRLANPRDRTQRPVYVSKEVQHAMEQKAANTLHNHIGCKARSPFMALPNFRWETFWLVGVAHALLLGVVKDLVHVLFRKKSDSIPYGDEYHIPNTIRETMLAAVKKLCPTSGYPRGLTNILGCELPAVADPPAPRNQSKPLQITE